MSITMNSNPDTLTIKCDLLIYGDTYHKYEKTVTHEEQRRTRKKLSNYLNEDFGDGNWFTLEDNNIINQLNKEFGIGSWSISLNDKQRRTVKKRNS